MSESDLPLPMGPVGTDSDELHFDFTSGATASLTKSSRRLGRLMGVVWLGAGALLLILGRSTVFGGSTTFVPVVIFLIALGGAFIGLSFWAERSVLTAKLNGRGVMFGMSTPPDWTLRWADAGGWIQLARGYTKGSPREARSPGWIITSNDGFEANIEFDLGRAIVSTAVTNGWRTVNEKKQGRYGGAVLEVITLDYPSNTGGLPASRRSSTNA